MSGKETRELPYRPCVGAVVINRDGLVLVAQRADMDKPAWQLPQGGIDRDETPRQAVMRELAEEIGTTKAEIVAEARDWLCYDFPDDLAGRPWKGRYRGQKQKWFAVRFSGIDEDIDLAAGNRPEFRDWKWVPMDSLPDLAVPFKRPVYEALVAEFRSLAPMSGGKSA